MYINVANKYPVGGWGDVTDEGNDEGDVILHIIDVGLGIILTSEGRYRVYINYRGCM